MASRHFHNTDIFFSSDGRDSDSDSSDHHTSYPYGHPRDRPRSPRRKHRSRKHPIDDLRDPYAVRTGDLGWTLGYATAWLYRHLNSNRPEITDALDQIREHLDEETVASDAFMIFPILDRVIFAGKLKHNVHMKWKSEPSFSPGITYQQGRLKEKSGTERVCIELNMTPFDELDGDIDVMLDALIHQMVHAFFCVTCGGLPEGQPSDGRLMDGVEFCVIMLTIRDISRSCRNHVLPVQIHAETRRLAMCPDARREPSRYLSVDPRHALATERPSDGRSHCYLDNRHVRPPEIKNWQVEKYSVSIDLDMDSKGSTIFDYGRNNKLERCHRMVAPPSKEYIELIWDDKRVMAPRKKALEFKSIQKRLKKDSKYELKVPECPDLVFAQLYNVFTKGDTYAPKELVVRTGVLVGPPVIAPASSAEAAWLEQDHGVVNHLQTFKVAEDMEFEELEQLVLERLWMIQTTQEDPVKILQELYDVKNNKGPVHAELHKWAREFLKRSDGFETYEEQKQWYENLGNYWSSWYDAHRSTAEWLRSQFGISNYEKVRAWFPHSFQKLYESNSAFKDDCKAVYDYLFAAQYKPYVHEDDMFRRPDYSGLLYDRLINFAQNNTDINLFNRVPYRRRDIYSPLARALPSSNVSSLDTSAPILRNRSTAGRRRPMLSLPAPEVSSQRPDDVQNLTSTQPIARPLWESNFAVPFDPVLGR